MKLHVTIWKDFRGLFRARCKSLPGCVAVGTSHDDALAKMKLAISGYVASLHSAACPEVTHELVERQLEPCLK